MSKDDINLKLIHAAFFGDELTVSKCLRAGANVNAIVKGEGPALYFALAEGHLQLAKVLMLYGARTDIRDVRGRTAFRFTLNCWYGDLADDLLHDGADVNERDMLGNTLLHQVSTQAKELHGEFARCYLLGHGADVNARNNRGETPLHMAARRGAVDSCIQFLRAGAHVNEPSSRVKSPLYLAVERGHSDVVRCLLQYGADPNAAYEYPSACNSQHIIRTTPLHTAACLGRFKIAEMLLNAGANVNAGDECGCTPLHQAAARGSVRLVRLLLRHGADINTPAAAWPPLQEAVMSEQQSLVSMMIQLGAEVNGTGSNKQTALNRAAYAGNVGMVELLLECGADVTQKDSLGRTALHECADKNCTAAAELLLKRGSVLDAQDKDGATPLYRAAWLNKPKMVEWLLMHGADPAISNKEGATPLQCADSKGYRACARILRKYAEISPKAE